MKIDVNVTVDGKEKGGLMGVSLEEIAKPVITKKKRKKKKSLLQKAIESSIKPKSNYTTEEV